MEVVLTPAAPAPAPVRQTWKRKEDLLTLSPLLHATTTSSDSSASETEDSRATWVYLRPKRTKTREADTTNSSSSGNSNTIMAPAPALFLATSKDSNCYTYHSYTDSESVRDRFLAASSKNSVNTVGEAGGTSTASENCAQQYSFFLHSLPDELISLILSYNRPWANYNFLLNKQVLKIMQEQNPYVRITPPVLPCSVHLECDVLDTSPSRSRNGGGNGTTNNNNNAPSPPRNPRLVQRCIYNVSQLLWTMPLAVQRFEWVPGKYCRAREDLIVTGDDDTCAVWKRILKHVSERQQATEMSKDTTVGERRQDQFPHYCEVTQGENLLTMRAYISDVEAQALIQLAQKNARPSSAAGNVGVAAANASGAAAPLPSSEDVTEIIATAAAARSST
ncbi:unnamed protein product [Amoebophrya sp. A120]|nr:unnamed protein product [Amoebophrya sp. A120]|eukprot:GSA120T00009417001.1